MDPQSPRTETPGRNFSPAFLKAIEFILPHESDYARGHWGDENFVVTENVPGDDGGLTKYGIDQRSHPHVDIRNLTRDGAVAIYHDEWREYNIDAFPEKIAIAQFDVRVNGGHAVKWLQLALNKIAGTTLQADGIMGEKTIAAAHAFNNETAVVRYFLRERDERFEAIATGPRAKFLEGWLQRDRDLRKFLSV